jgi:hypothetical protein
MDRLQEIYDTFGKYGLRSPPTLSEQEGLSFLKGLKIGDSVCYVNGDSYADWIEYGIVVKILPKNRLVIQDHDDPKGKYTNVVPRNKYNGYPLLMPATEEINHYQNKVILVRKLLYDDMSQEDFDIEMDKLK